MYWGARTKPLASLSVLENLFLIGCEYLHLSQCVLLHAWKHLRLHRWGSSLNSYDIVVLQILMRAPVWGFPAFLEQHFGPTPRYNQANTARPWQEFEDDEAIVEQGEKDDKMFILRLPADSCELLWAIV